MMNLLDGIVNKGCIKTIQRNIPSCIFPLLGTGLVYYVAGVSLRVALVVAAIREVNQHPIPRGIIVPAPW